MVSNIHATFTVHPIFLSFIFLVLYSTVVQRLVHMI